MLTQTKALAGQSLDPVAFMCAFDMLLGDSKTDTGMPQRVPAAENRNLRRASPVWLLEDESEMSGS